MKVSLFLLTALFFSSAFAEQKKPAARQTCTTTLKNPIGLYETFDNQGTNIGVRGDILYMVYQSPVFTYASLQTVTSQILHSQILNVPGEMSLGCDVALTYTMRDQPGYSFEAGWYHIVAKFNRDVQASNIVPAHSVVLTSAAPGTASVNAHVTLNLFDLLMKKDFALGDWVSFAPAAGLVGGYMDGTSAANFNATSGGFSVASGSNTASTVATLNYTTKFEGIGLKLGGSSSFKIWKGLKLKAELFYSTLYGLSKADLDYVQNGVSLTTTITGGVKGSAANYQQHHVRAFFDSLIGLGWEHRFRNDSLFMDLHAGWKFQTFSDGWKEFEAEFNDSLHELGLSGQGLQAGATFKF